ncbi:MAG: dihydrofolate reductase [Muribaculaceae bacterium]|nr:dihydrofolate reductase [Muribaculaceae bacterium]
MFLSIIVAIDRLGAIGRKGQLLFHISDDLRRFKAITMGHPIIMGRKTFESFPKGALPGRRNIVVTRSADYSASGIETASSVEAAIDMVEDVDEAFVIGGGEIYRQTIARADRLYLTIVETETADADTFFPNFSPNDWEITEASQPETDAKSGLTYRFVTLQRVDDV